MFGNLVHITHPENILKTIESNLDDLVVHATKKITKRSNAALVNKIANLLRLLESAGSGIGDSPTSLLAGLKVTVREQVDERRDDVGIYDSLDLSRVSSRDVGDCPACFLTDTILRGTEERKKGG
jgi:hypothetical protein